MIYWSELPDFRQHVTNNNAPDTGNMEVLAKFGTPAQQEKWLKPLMEGKTRSVFAMTERDTASSDARNVSCSIVEEGDEIVINGRKVWLSNASHPDLAFHIVMGRSHPNNPPYSQQSAVIVPANNPGVKLLKPLCPSFSCGYKINVDSNL